MNEDTLVAAYLGPERRYGYAQTFRDKDAGTHIPNVDVAAALAILKGMRPREVAQIYGIGKRTAYRWRRELVAIESVRVDGWVATFARRRNSPPVRLTAWEVA
jgi:hypothetical protein